MTQTPTPPVTELLLWRKLMQTMNKFDDQLNELPPEQQDAFFYLHLEELIANFECEHADLIAEVSQRKHDFDNASTQHKEAAL
ncbi:hypothetical protein [Vibrio scophthalmi]|uniref:Uncharacterized protein n=1 Tax=Vibrio scophthalmi TaxID=45658 RepID=A0A1E3WJM6_9VIBR|nr:hypothetical protein [Vibrio scophthalmi]ODS09707.1 hypothetical protein VSF3289_03270 [Vibrio scophthalmi]